jgi:putative flavoprotein involved in K+ transport
MPETIGFIEGYAAAIAAPVQTHTRVESVHRTDDGYLVMTDRGTWRSRGVVIASGSCNVAAIPALAAALPRSVRSLSPLEYRSPDQLEPGAVLVVGASASGTQIAEEIHRSGRPVTLSVGEHVRLPRRYRGRDIQWWMDAIGLMDEFYTGVDNIERVRGLPSLQLAGSDDRRDMDLNALAAQGIRLTGRLAGIAGSRVQFSGSFRNLCQMADLKLNRLLDRIDEWVTEHGLEGEVAPAERFDPTRVEASPPLLLDLERGAVRTILWATGFRPDHSWLELPVFDRKGRIEHDGGVVASPGLYVMGLPFLRRRKSTLIDGAGDDARDLSAHLAAWLDGRAVVPTGEHNISGLRGAA